MVKRRPGWFRGCVAGTLCCLCLLYMSPGVQARDGKHTKNKTTADSVLEALEQYEEKIEGILLKRVDLKEQVALLERDITRMDTQRQELDERVKRFKTRLGKHIRLLYLSGGNSWLGELISGRDMVTLTLRRAYLSRWAQTTEKLLARLNQAKQQLQKQSEDLAMLQGQLKELEQSLLEEEENLRSESEDQLSLLFEIKRDERKKKRLQQELHAANRRLDRKVSNLSDGGFEYHPPSLQWRCPIVGGTILSGFGQETHDEIKGSTVNKGLLLAAGAGVPVIAPAPGTVVFSERFRGFGQLVIIALKDGRHLVLAKLGSRSVKKGAHVREGQPVGRTGPAKQLYVELRQGGTPVDPAPFMSCTR